MGMSLDQINGHLDKIVLTFEDEGQTDTLNIWFSSNAITPAFQRLVKRDSSRMAMRRTQWEKRRQGYLDRGEELPADLLDEEAPLDREEQADQLRMLTTVIKRWDLWEREPTEHEPNPPALPITFDTLERLGYPVIGRISREIVASLDVDPTKSSRTDNGSAALTVIPPSRNGSFS